MSALGKGKARVIGLLALLALLVPMLSTPVHSQDNGKVLRIHQTTYPDIADPQKSSFTSEIEILAILEIVAIVALLPELPLATEVGVEHRDVGK